MTRRAPIITTAQIQAGLIVVSSTTTGNFSSGEGMVLKEPMLWTLEVGAVALTAYQ